MNTAASLFRGPTAAEQFMGSACVIMAAHIKNRKDAGLDLNDIIRELMSFADAFNRDHEDNLNLYRNMIKSKLATRFIPEWERRKARRKSVTS